MSLSSVAICIPTYNQAPYLERAVQSALAQRHPCEVWVSDDASTDETPSVMARLLKEHPQIKHFRQEHNLGIKGNPTWIMKQPNTEFIVRLDSDDELDLVYAGKLSKELSENPTAAYAHAAVQEIDANGQKHRLRFLARPTGFQNGEQSLQASVTGYRVAANICMFRSAALKQADYYRDLSFCEDWDLAIRLADAGWGNVYVNEVLASYRAWDTPIRSRRKLAEVDGCHRMIADSLTPAFKRRHWSLAPIIKMRRRLALNHAVCLRLLEFNDAERSNLKQALCQLGDTWALRWKFHWIRTPLAPLFQLPAKIKSQGRVWIKSLLFKRVKNQ